MIFGFQNKRTIGNTGEDIATQYLEWVGYKILKRNYKEKFDELDIIGKSKKRGLVFFEVKTLFYETDLKIKKMEPEDNFTKNKSKKVKRISEMFVAKHQKMINQKNGYHIDLIAIKIINNDRKILIKHYKDV